MRLRIRTEHYMRVLWSVWLRPLAAGLVSLALVGTMAALLFGMGALAENHGANDAELHGHPVDLVAGKCIGIELQRKILKSQEKTIGQDGGTYQPYLVLATAIEAAARDGARCPDGSDILSLAAHYHLRAVDKGSLGSALSLGRMYLHGLGVERDKAKARRWFRVFALYLLGSAMSVDERIEFAKSFLEPYSIPSLLKEVIREVAEVSFWPSRQLLKFAIELVYSDNHLLARDGAGTLLSHLSLAIYENANAEYALGRAILDKKIDWEGRPLDGVDAIGEKIVFKPKDGTTLMERSARKRHLLAELFLAEAHANGLYGYDTDPYMAYVYYIRARQDDGTPDDAAVEAVRANLTAEAQARAIKRADCLDRTWCY